MDADGHRLALPHRRSGKLAGVGTPALQRWEGR